MSQNWAICIGIDRYDNLQSLQYAKRDAEALREFFEKEAGFDKVYFFAEDAPSIPTDYGEPMRSVPGGATLRRFLRIRFEQPFLKPSDNLWFFFAGHGRRERDRDYLMPMDADPGNVTETAIAVSYVTERLRRCGAQNVLLLDACRNEGARDGQGIGGDRQAGVVAISSCSPNERSYEIGELQHGVFTYALMEGLRLQGETNCATVERLDRHLRFRVPDLCGTYRKPRQTPYTVAEPMEKQHLILLPKLASLSDLNPLRLDALQAEASGDLESAEQLWWRIIAVSPADAQAREAVRRIAQKQPAVQAAPEPAAAPEPVAASAARTAGTPPKRPVRLTRRRVVGMAGFAAVAAGTAVAVPMIRRFSSRPVLRTVSFDSVTVDSEGARVSTEQHTAEMFTETLGFGGSLDMVLVPGGSFTMGSPVTELERQPNEGPQHHVMLEPFFIGAAPVTQAQWKAVVMAHPAPLQRDLDPTPSFFRSIDLPVESITWNQADELCQRLGAITGRSYRLPSEAEWEYACRAGATGPFHFGPTITTDLANYCGTGGAVAGDSDGRSIASDTYLDVKYTSGAYGQGPPGVFRGTTTRAGTFPPNRFGLYDMHGNVWEYCLDSWSPSYSGAPSDGGANLAGTTDSPRVLRGGSWSHNPAICRSAFRDNLDPALSGWQGRIGMRVVCTV